MDKKYIFNNKIELNYFINLIIRIDKILGTFLDDPGVYKGSIFVSELNKIYIFIITEITKELDKIEDDNNELKKVINNSHLLEIKNLNTYIEYANMGEVSETINDILGPILRLIENISIKNKIGPGMYLGIQFNSDLRCAINDVKKQFPNDTTLQNMFIHEMKQDIYINSLVNVIIRSNKYYLKKLKKEPIYFLSDYIVFHRSKYIFINIFNGKEYSIRNHGNYDKLIDILLKNYGKYVTYEEIEKESGMDFLKTGVFKKIIDKRKINKKITDIKCNLITNIEKNIGINKGTLNFIQVSNGLKISFN